MTPAKHLTYRQLSVGPEAALSLLVGQVITQLTLSDPHTIPANPEKVAIAIATVITLQVRGPLVRRVGCCLKIFLQVGLITFLLGICRLGFLDVVLSRPLLRGFITAVGIIILIEQVRKTFSLGIISDQSFIACTYAWAQPSPPQCAHPDPDQQARLSDQAYIVHESIYRHHECFISDLPHWGENHQARIRRQGQGFEVCSRNLHHRCSGNLYVT